MKNKLQECAVCESSKKSGICVMCPAISKARKAPCLTSVKCNKCDHYQYNESHVAGCIFALADTDCKGPSINGNVIKIKKHSSKKLVGFNKRFAWVGPLMIQLDFNSYEKKPQVTKYTVSSKEQTKRAIAVYYHKILFVVSWTTNKETVKKFDEAWTYARSNQ